MATDGAILGGLVARERLLGNGCVMLAGIAWSVYAVSQRRATVAENAFRLLAPIFVVATLTTLPGLLVPAAWVNPTGTGPTVMLAVLTLLCTVGVYLVYERSQRLVAVNVLAVVLTTIPIFAVTFAGLLLDEPITPRIILGGTVIVTGVLLTASEPAPALAAARPAREL